MPSFRDAGPGRPMVGRGKTAAHLTLLACVALLVARPVNADSADPRSPVGDLQAAARDTRPSAALPGPPRPLPETIPFPAFTRSAELTSSHPLFGDAAIHRFSAIAPSLTDSFEAAGFSGRLLSRMTREAQRYRRENVSNALTAGSDRPFDEVDSITSDRRGEEAERIVTRSVHRTLDMELERLARRSAGFGAILDFLGHPSSPRTRPEPSPGSEVPRQGALGFRRGAGSDDRVTGSVGLRLDAHPALVMRTVFLGVQGRLEVPVRNEPVRLSIECPVGSRGRAALTSGARRDGQGWANLTFNFTF